MIHFTLDGTDYEFDDNKLALKEAIAVKQETGLGVRLFQFGINMSEPEALQAMVWLAMKRSGTAVRFADVDFDCVELLRNLRRVDPEGDATDPPSASATPTGSSNGSTPSDAEPSTSEPSPTT